MYNNDFIEAFVKGTLGKKRTNSSWKVVDYPDGAQELRYYPTESGMKISDGKGVFIYETLGYRSPDGITIYNAARLAYIGTHMAWGSRTRNWGQCDQQRDIEKAGAIGIPFTIFRDVPITGFKFIHKPIAEQIQVAADTWKDGKKVVIMRPRHFVGAAIFNVGDNNYLFDIDRNELKNGIVNPFVVLLPKPCTTVEEAYDSLIPEEIKQATTPVYRQGEFFFVFVSDESPVITDLTDEEWEILKYKPMRIGFTRQAERMFMDDVEYHENNLTPEQQAFNDAHARYDEVRNKLDSINPASGSIDGGSGSHRADKIIQSEGNIYVSGKISHTRREHGDLILEGWYKVVKNNAVKSITVRGEID